ncbi:MBL fold metallo-hydrolase [Nicoliella spurrieriana]|uniref:MBL fold metallo-hydrolase n=1 Tax=Nicoliella spurrieriana TaxID=2925830 RepID=A0A976RRR9_9LACO|nr:MBL fold metallo-hydrolase [Nicoliella spurrieriana]UQS86421.1 MBL fold metallo-hydrolase [Nicoliella spurrieriana]
MKIKILGFYGGYPTNGIGTSSYLIQSGDYNLLLDCGSNALNELQSTINPLDLNAVILSHYHHDHTADVGVLQYYWQLHLNGRREPILPIYGNTEDPINFATLNWDNATVAKGYNDLVPLHLGPFTISFLKTHHPVPAFAMRITDESGKTMVFTADTSYFDGLIKFSHDADLLITDTNFFADKKGLKWHMTSEESGKLAKNANAKRLVLSHLPGSGNLNQLVAEAKLQAGADCEVEHAIQNQLIIL